MRTPNFRFGEESPFGPAYDPDERVDLAALAAEFGADDGDGGEPFFDDGDQLVDLADLAADADDGAKVPIRPVTCWNCNKPRDCGLDPCPHCSADCLPF